MRPSKLRIRGCHPYRPTFQMVPLTYQARLVPVRSPLLREYLLISFPTGTEMFQFPAFALLTLYIQVKSTCFNHRSLSVSATSWLRAQPAKGRRGAYVFTRVKTLNRQQSKIVRWVAPFGNSGIKGCSRLPRTYRRVPRPSSPLAAKASTKRPSRA